MMRTWKESKTSPLLSLFNYYYIAQQKVRELSLNSDNNNKKNNNQ